MTRSLAIAAGAACCYVVVAVAWQDDTIQLPDKAQLAQHGTALALESTAGLLAAEGNGLFLGARSCAAAACHGGIHPDPRTPGSQRHEFTFWLDQDPHARAYRTLWSEASQRMLQRLGITGTQGQLLDPAGLVNCLGCHNPQPSTARQHESYFARDGVSCEMCHGPAEKWIGPHVSHTWPELKRSGQARKLGFMDTADPLVRAQTCVSCHVGSPGREVNHDLIAAGHPPLKFEMAAYHDLLPKHWRDAAERRTNPNLERELWAAGQFAAAEASLRLLASRAKRATQSPPAAVWPEFAEYDCYACHHELAHPSWRQQAATSDRPLGMPAWGSWYFALLPLAEREKLRPLREAMERSFRPDPEEVAKAAAAVQLERQSFDETLGNLAARSALAPANWDEATQIYLALVAIEQAQRDATRQADENVASQLQRLRNQLKFPEGADSPRDLFRSEGGRGVSREAIQQLLRELLLKLQRPTEQRGS